MKMSSLRHVLLCLGMSLALLLGTAHAQKSTGSADPKKDAVEGVEAKNLLKQIAQDREQLLRERQQALKRAAKASQPEEKLKIMLELQNEQRERKTKLQADESKVLEAKKKQQADKRTAQANSK
jgi:hypothetical protein